MTDRPIIFSAPMVQAIMDGRKTQTRRVLKPQPFVDTGGISGWSIVDHRGALASWSPLLPGLHQYYIGDRLWVREVWGLGLSDHGDCPRYKATLDYQCGDKIKSPHEGPFVWRSPIHMPRWASRLTLTVTDVRVQRVQEISEADARAEGVRGDAGGPWGCEGLIEDFSDLWNSIHGPDAWDRNDWVCALTFTVDRHNIDAGEPE